MKTDKIYFLSKNGTIDSELVKAIEALPEEMFILPHDAEKECIKKDGKIIIYPYNSEQRFCTMERIETEEYRESIEFTEFKINGVEYKVLSRNPISIYENIFAKKAEPEVRTIYKTLDKYYFLYFPLPDIEIFGELHTYWDSNGESSEHELVMRGAKKLEKLCKTSDNELITVTNKFNDTSTMRFEEFKEKFLEKARKIYLSIDECKRDKDDIYKILDAGLKSEGLK